MKLNTGPATDAAMSSTRRSKVSSSRLEPISSAGADIGARAFVAQARATFARETASLDIAVSRRLPEHASLSRVSASGGGAGRVRRHLAAKIAGNAGNRGDIANEPAMTKSR